MVFRVILIFIASCLFIGCQKKETAPSPEDLNPLPGYIESYKYHEPAQHLYVCDLFDRGTQRIHRVSATTRAVAVKQARDECMKESYKDFGCAKDVKVTCKQEIQKTGRRQ